MPETCWRTPFAFKLKECNYSKDQSQRNNVRDLCASLSPFLSSRSFLSSSSFDAEFKYRRKYSPFDFGSSPVFRHLSFLLLPVKERQLDARHRVFSSCRRHCRRSHRRQSKGVRRKEKTDDRGETKEVIYRQHP